MAVTFEQLKSLGFHFQTPGGIAPRMLFDEKDIDMVAKDAALVTAANTAVPAELLAYIENRVIDVLTRPHKATEIFGEVRKGDWTTPYAKFRMDEITGSTQPYTDYGQSRTSGVNSNWITREQYVFETVIQYGDLEEAVSSAAKIQLAARKQSAAAKVIANDVNAFYLKGVAGRDITGILNDPDLPDAVAPLVGSATGKVLWEEKNMIEIYEDVLYLFQTLVDQCDGLVDQTADLELVVSPQAAVSLGKASPYDKSVMDLLNKYFSSLTVVTLPELADDASGESVMLIAKTLDGNPVGELAFSDKVRAGRVIPDLSSFSQKWVSTTYGAIIYYPVGIATMRGVRGGDAGDTGGNTGDGGDTGDQNP